MSDEFNNNTGNQYPPEEQNYYNQVGSMPPKEEKASVGLAILSYLIPLAGLIIFLVNKDKRPKTAKVSGICALVSFIINIVLSIVIMVSGGVAMLGLSDTDTSSSDDTAYMQDLGDGETVDAEDSEDNIVSGDVIGDFGCKVKSAELTTDYSGRDAVIITYEFTNNSSDAISFDLALSASAFQDGIGLETAILDSDKADWLDVEIKPGVTKDVNKAYVLNDTTTNVEIEITELISFSDEKLVSTVTLG